MVFCKHQLYNTCTKKLYRHVKSIFFSVFTIKRS